MAIPNSIIHAFKNCKSAQELWNSLQQMYEGSEDVKENKKDMLKQKFENFCQQNNEKMTSQYLRYVQLVDELVAAAIRRTENLRTLKLNELFGILSAYQMEIDAQEPKSTHATLGSAALYAPINNPSYQSYQPIYHTTSTPIVSFPETPTQTPSTTHTNPFSNLTLLITYGQAAFMAEETNYFHLCPEDLDGIPADDLEEMDINYQMAMISYRAKKFYQRTGRQFKKHNLKTGFRLDKSKLKCFNCQQLGHFARECKYTSTQPSTSVQLSQRPSTSSNNANIAEQDFADWSFQAEDASISNSALMANDSTSSFKVTDDLCTPECLEKLNVFKRINSQLCNELESLQVVKANFFECERNYKEKIEETEKTISSLKHEDTNKHQGEKYEKLFKMSSTTELVNKKGAGLGYNNVEPPSAYTPIVEISCKPVVNLVYDDELDIHKVVQTDNLSDLNPSISTCSDEDNTPIKPETEKSALKTKKRTKKIKKHSSVLSKLRTFKLSVPPQMTMLLVHLINPKGVDQRKEKLVFSGKQVNLLANKSAETSKSSIAEIQSSISFNNQNVCLMCGDKNHFAADCFYNPRSRIVSKKQRKGGKETWRKSSVSSEEPGRNSRKKISEASTSDSRKKQAKRRTSEVKPNWSAKTKSLEEKTKNASDDCQKKQTFPTTSKVKQIWKKKAIDEPSVQPPVPPTTSTSSVPPKMMSKKFTYNDANGKPKTTWAWESKSNLWIVDSGCSRHMTGNKTHQHKYEPFFGGSVAFGSDPVGGYITGRGTITNGKKPGFVVPNDQILLRAPRRNNMYMLDMSTVAPLSNISCFVSKASLDESSLWHRRLCHCKKSRYTWVFFLSTKDETAETLKSFILRVENESDHHVKIIRSDQGTEFKNHVLNSFCESKGITRQFSAPRTPQQNGVAERKNRTLIEAARTMLSDVKLPLTFWAEAVNTACYVQNRVLVVKAHGMNPYEIWHKRKPFIGFLKPFGCQCTILNTKDHLAKFAEKSAEGYFVGYSSHAKAYREYIKASRIIEESANVQFNEHTINKPGTGPDWPFDLDSFTSAFNLVREFTPETQATTTDSSQSKREEDFRVELPIASRQILAESTSAQNDVS
ncbi:hypothetical protein E3N88_12436 [Mikania micrantha]|uniref:Integrase catalytic domain-containing protein n=1 Tax=Mikania micrantha TaxID=192012 RepID=A0A5N6P832_9ASTR|nr:hypothetical protein E3N88_12436 [Mikania micrantha]